MRINYFPNKINSLEFYTDCTDKGKWINDTLIPKRCIRFSYKTACKLIKEYCPNIWYNMGLEFPNPWSYKTYRSRDGRYIIITHSMIEYVFKTNII